MLHKLLPLLAVLLSVFAHDAYAINSRAGKAAWKKHQQLVVNVSHKTGADPVTLAATCGMESGFKAKAKNKRSSATGGCQFTAKTWPVMLKKHGRKYGLSMRTPRTNMRASLLMAAEYTKDNTKVLRTVLGRKPTRAEVYMAHLLGPTGASKMLTARNGKKAARVLPDAASRNRKLFYTDSGRARSVSQFKQYVAWRFNTHAGSYKPDIVRLVAAR